MSSPK